MSTLDLTTRITQLLRTFQATTPGVVGASVVSNDGFAIVSELPQDIEERRVAAMSAAMLALGEQTTHEFEQGHLERVFVEGERGYTIIVSAGPEAVLSVVARKDAKLGLVFLQMERVAAAVRQAME